LPFTVSQLATNSSSVRGFSIIKFTIRLSGGCSSGFPYDYLLNFCGLYKLHPYLEIHPVRPIVSCLAGDPAWSCPWKQEVGNDCSIACKTHRELHFRTGCVSIRSKVSSQTMLIGVEASNPNVYKQ
ncbi:hypothetical protein KCU83_g313, partial [Aureobasidium melanogenum]